MQIIQMAVETCAAPGVRRAGMAGMAGEARKIEV